MLLTQTGDKAATLLITYNDVRKLLVGIVDHGRNFGGTLTPFRIFIGVQYYHFAPPDLVPNY